MPAGTRRPARANFQRLAIKVAPIPEIAPGPPEGVQDSPAPLTDPRRRIRREPIRLAEFSPLLPYEGARPQAGAQYRTLRANLLQHPQAPRVLVFTSCGSGDGKTLSAVNTAGVLAIEGNDAVLLVEADLRQPALAAALGLPRTPGLAEALHGDCPLEDAIVQTQQYPNLYVLAAGQARRSPADLLDTARWRQLCAIAKSSFRFVLIDTPLTSAATGYDLVEAVADGVVFVVRPDHSDRTLCLAALRKISAAGKLTGVLVNCAQNSVLYRTSGR